MATTATRCPVPRAASRSTAQTSSWIDRMKVIRTRAPAVTAGPHPGLIPAISHQALEPRKPSTSPPATARLMAAPAKTTVMPMAATACITTVPSRKPPWKWNAGRAAAPKNSLARLNPPGPGQRPATSSPRYREAARPARPRPASTARPEPSDPARFRNEGLPV